MIKDMKACVKLAIQVLKDEVLGIVKNSPDGVGPADVTRKLGLPRVRPVNDGIAQNLLTMLQGEGKISHNTNEKKWYSS